MTLPAVYIVLQLLLAAETKTLLQLLLTAQTRTRLHRLLRQTMVQYNTQAVAPIHIGIAQLVTLQFQTLALKTH